jgi:hypothetical protein
MISKLEIGRPKCKELMHYYFIPLVILDTLSYWNADIIED